MARKNPWTSKEGYWIAPDGKFTEVMDHYTEIKDDPGAFGFNAERAAKWNRVKDHDKVLVLAMKKGFVRVRGHVTYTTFELWKLTDTLMNHMKRLDDKIAFYPDEKVRIYELSTHKKWKGEIVQFKHLTADRFHETKE